MRGMSKKLLEIPAISFLGVVLFLVCGNIYAYIKVENSRRAHYRSHDKYSLSSKGTYVDNVDSVEVNEYGDLCAIEGSHSLCGFSEGERMHRFRTDKYGFKTLGNLHNSDVVVLGDSFLAASGGDDATEQYGAVIASLASLRVYEAAHPGGIDDYNRRHSMFRKIKPNAKFIYLLFEGNDFSVPDESVSRGERSESWIRCGLFCETVHGILSFYKKLPLYKLIATRVAAMKAQSTIGTPKSQVLVGNVSSGRLQAFWKPYVSRTVADQLIDSGQMSYILGNVSNVCGVVYVPTAYATYVLKAPLKDRHPSLYAQFAALKNDGIDVVDLTPYLREAASDEVAQGAIWWSDDTHWNARGIRVAAEVSVDLLGCLDRKRSVR